MKKNHNLNNEYHLLYNKGRIKSSISPFFAGDIKTDYNHYILEPTTEIDLINKTSTRNVIFEINNEMYFLNGQTKLQEDDEVSTKADIGIYEVIRENKQLKLATKTYISADYPAEVSITEITNNSNQEYNVKITTAVPLYCRSAETIFNHRHVTSLLNKGIVLKNGIVVKPTLSFDERGHVKNETNYVFLSYLENSEPVGIIPTLEDFVNNGSLNLPKGLNNYYQDGDNIDGYEMMGAVSFKEITIKPKQTIKLTNILSITEDESLIEKMNDFYLNHENTLADLKKSTETIKKDTDYINFGYKNESISKLLKEVSYQPIYRMIFGNSFSPHHDYGKGGKGWRDLFQDLLTLLITNDKDVSKQLFNNFAGIRLDGSNATIIGDNQGEFKADRNNITRVWSDHGCWPLLTVKMYLEETKDFSFLQRKQTYFDDKFTHYTKKTKEMPNDFTARDSDNNIIYGTILEHLLRENVVGLLNKGIHGWTRLENADWNDAMDMASINGETTAFTHMYSGNLKTIVKWLKQMDEKIELDLILYDLIKNEDLHIYFDQTAKNEFVLEQIETKVLIDLLEKLINETDVNLKQAYINGYYKGYTSNLDTFIESDNEMFLTAQAIPLMVNNVSHEEAKSMAKKAKEFLFDEKVGGYRLNSKLKNDEFVKMGRYQGFAYGHKENGSMFSHMDIMYAYGLYNYDLVDLADEVIKTLLNKSLETNIRGIPEYFNEKGEPKYMYLTGSASWLIKTLREKVFGIDLSDGYLSFNPKLRKEDFINKKAFIETYVYGKKIKIEFINDKDLDYDEYRIDKIVVDGKITTEKIKSAQNKIEVYLNEKIRGVSI